MFYVRLGRRAAVFYTSDQPNPGICDSGYMSSTSTITVLEPTPSYISSPPVASTPSVQQSHAVTSLDLSTINTESTTSSSDAMFSPSFYVDTLFPSSDLISPTPASVVQSDYSLGLTGSFSSTTLSSESYVFLSSTASLVCSLSVCSSVQLLSSFENSQVSPSQSTMAIEGTPVVVTMTTISSILPVTITTPKPSTDTFVWPCLCASGNSSDWNATYWQFWIIRTGTVQKHNTTKFQRSVTSVYDERAVSVVMGTVSIALVIALLVGLVISDLSRLRRDFKSFYRSRKDRHSTESK